MCKQDAASVLWKDQNRRDSGPWKQLLRDMQEKAYYRPNFTRMIGMVETPAILTWHLRLMLAAAIAIFVFCFIVEPEILLNQWILPTFYPKEADSSLDAHFPEPSIVESASPSTFQGEAFDQVSTPTPKLHHALVESGRKDSLPLAEAEVFCQERDMRIWEDRSKPRKIYELIYLNSKTYSEMDKALHRHIGLRYNDVDYFVLVDWNETFRSDSESPWPDARYQKMLHEFLWADLWPYDKKMIYHTIQPSSNPSSVVASGDEDLIEITHNVGCERRTQDGDSIAVHYTARLADGTILGSSKSSCRPAPVVSTLGTSNLKGWDQGLLNMCIGEKRTVIIPPHLAYGDKSTGPIPANSTLIFETELVNIKGFGDPWPYWTDQLLTKDPLVYVRESFAYNAMYLQVIPFLSGEQKIEEGDVIMVAELDQIPTSTALTALRNCEFPPRLAVFCQVDGYSRWGVDQSKVSRQVATFYNGSGTVLPQTLRESDCVYEASGTSGAAVMFDRTRYCGPCYGANPTSEAGKSGCCNSCEEVMDAYNALPWAVGNAMEHVEQCVRELRPFGNQIGYD